MNSNSAPYAEKKWMFMFHKVMQWHFLGDVENFQILHA